MDEYLTDYVQRGLRLVAGIGPPELLSYNETLALMEVAYRYCQMREIPLWAIPALLMDAHLVDVLASATPRRKNLASRLREVFR